MRIFHKKWREKLDSYALDKWKQESQSGKVNPFTLRRGQVPLEFFKKPRNAQEKRKYIKKYGKFLPKEKEKRIQSINPLDDIYNELLPYDYVLDPNLTLEDINNYASYIKNNIDRIKRPNVRKEMEELLREAQNRVEELSRNKEYWLEKRKSTHAKEPRFMRIRKGQKKLENYDIKIRGWKDARGPAAYNVDTSDESQVKRGRWLKPVETGFGRELMNMSSEELKSEKFDLELMITGLGDAGYGDSKEAINAGKELDWIDSKLEEIEEIKKKLSKGQLTFKEVERRNFWENFWKKRVKMDEVAKRKNG